MQEIIAGLGTAVPIIYYTKASHHLLPAIVRVGANVLSVDWRMPLALVRKVAGPRVAIQGNLDPAILFASMDKIRTATLDIVGELAGHGHILNLGHGILQHTPVENAQLFIRTGQQAALQVQESKAPVASR
jgi:uroporphyrinogen decarboxylase